MKCINNMIDDFLGGGGCVSLLYSFPAYRYSGCKRGLSFAAEVNWLIKSVGGKLRRGKIGLIWLLKHLIELEQKCVSCVN